MATDSSRGRQAGDRTVQLVSLEMLGPRIQLVAARVLAGETARRPLPARALVRTRPSGAVLVLALGVRIVLGLGRGVHGCCVWPASLREKCGKRSRSGRGARLSAAEEGHRAERSCEEGDADWASVGVEFNNSVKSSEGRLPQVAQRPRQAGCPHAHLHTPPPESEPSSSFLPPLLQVCVAKGRRGSLVETGKL